MIHFLKVECFYEILTLRGIKWYYFSEKWLENGNVMISSRMTYRVKFTTHLVIFTSECPHKGLFQQLRPYISPFYRIVCSYIAKIAFFGWKMCLEFINYMFRMILRNFYAQKTSKIRIFWPLKVAVYSLFCRPQKWHLKNKFPNF